MQVARLRCCPGALHPHGWAPAKKGLVCDNPWWHSPCRALGLLGAIRALAASGGLSGQKPAPSQVGTARGPVRRAACCRRPQRHPQKQRGQKAWVDCRFGRPPAYLPGASPLPAWHEMVRPHLRLCRILKSAVLLSTYRLLATPAASGIQSHTEPQLSSGG